MPLKRTPHGGATLRGTITRKPIKANRAKKAPPKRTVARVGGRKKAIRGLA